MTSPAPTELELDALDLRRADPEALAAVRQQATTRGFAVIRGQHLGPDGLERFVGGLGPLVFTPGERPMPGHRFVFEVTNRNRTTPPRSVYHSDTSYVATPPAFTVLAAAEVPERGGATLVIDQYATYGAAPPELLRELAAVELLHVPTRVGDPGAAGAGHWHPVLRRHPANDRPVLYLSARERLAAARRDGIELTTTDAEHLIDRVHDHATSAVAPHRHHWRTGDVLVIDNRCTLHAADHSGVVGHRTLHRVMCGDGAGSATTVGPLDASSAT